MKPVIFLGRCYVETDTGVRRAFATPEEMEEMPIVHVLRPLGGSMKTSSRTISRNRKSTYNEKRRLGIAIPYAVQQEIAHARELRNIIRMSNIAAKA